MLSVPDASPVEVVVLLEEGTVVVEEVVVELVLEVVVVEVLLVPDVET